MLEDSEDVALHTVLKLREQGISLHWEHAQTADTFDEQLDHGFDAVIADYHVPGNIVRAVLAITRARFPDLPFIVISAAMSAEEGVELMRLGAQDYLDKERLERLGPSLVQSCERALERQNAQVLGSRYRTLFEELPVGVVRSSPTGETLEINPALLRILRFPDEATYRAESSLLKTEFVSETARENMVEALERDGFVTGFETETRRRDGTVAWLRLDISAIQNPDGTTASIDAVVTDVDDRRRAEAQRESALEDLRWSDTQRRALLKQVMTAQEEERRRIAQDIHDDAVQVMSAANIRLAMLGKKLDDAGLKVEVDRLIEAVSLATARLRDLLFELQPPALERSGLVAALSEQLHLLDAAGTLRSSLTGGLAIEPPPDRGLLIYRIAQEALVNVRKHSGASHVVVAVDSEEGGISISIKDDGQGFEPPDSRGIAARGHMGLASMVERAAAVGGRCAIETVPGAGTHVSLWVPSSDHTVSSAPVEALA